MYKKKCEIKISDCNIALPLYGIWLNLFIDTVRWSVSSTLNKHFMQIIHKHYIIRTLYLQLTFTYVITEIGNQLYVTI